MLGVILPLARMAYEPTLVSVWTWASRLFPVARCGLGVAFLRLPGELTLAFFFSIEAFLVAVSGSLRYWSSLGVWFIGETGD